MESTQPWLSTLTGTRIRIKIPSIDTNSQVTIIEYVEPPHSVPPVFTRHEFIEVFCVQSGVLTFEFLDEARMRIVAGQSVTCPSWKPHSFWNETDEPVSVLLVCSPGGLDQFFIESNQLAESLDKDLGKKSATESLDHSMKALRTKYGLEHVGSPPKL